MQEERPLLKKQNFLLIKILCVCLIIGLIFFPFLSNIPHSDSDYDTQIMPTKYIIIYICIFALIGISVYLLYEFYKYLRNFESSIQYDIISEHVKNLLYSVLVCGGLSILFFLLLSLLEEYNGAIMGTVAIFIFVSFLFAYVFNIKTGWELAHFEDDYVGGLTILGWIIFLSNFIPGLAIVIPIMMFRVFHKADEYASSFGFDENSEN